MLINVNQYLCTEIGGTWEGIESVCYDFERISPASKIKERRDAVKRHLVTFPEGIPLGLSRKESNNGRPVLSQF